jgi:signal transduction protein with GAF and PtsI domain
MNRHHERLQALVHAADTANEGHLEALVQHVSRTLGAERSTLYRMIDGELRSQVVEGAPGLDIHLAVGQGLAGWTAMAGVPLCINDPLKDDRFDARWDKASGYTTNTVVCMPVLDAEGQVMGVLQSLNKRGGFDDDDLLWLRGIAALCALSFAATPR